MRTAGDIVLGASDPRQQIRNDLHVGGLAAVRAATDRELHCRHGEGVGNAVLHQRQGLKRLRRRTEKGHEAAIADPREEAARRIHERRGDTVHRLHHSTPREHDPRLIHGDRIFPDGTL